jgi:hypothetical protein
MPTDTLPTIDPADLSRVSGGASSNDQITAALQQITSSLSQLSANRNQSDPTMMLLMMMMMNGGGGGGGVVAGAPAVAGSPPVINVDTSVLSHGGRGPGIFGGGGGGGCRPPCGSKKGW